MSTEMSLSVERRLEKYSRNMYVTESNKARMRKSFVSSCIIMPTLSENGPIIHQSRFLLAYIGEIHRQM